MNTNKAIIITGCSSGIGKACALHLDQLGYKVYAGIRKESDGLMLRKEASDRLYPIILDVTFAKSIAKAASRIEKENEDGIFALINNAGIGLGGVLEVTPVEEIRKLMEVNVIGLMAVTRAFIPMLRKNQGRIINMGSSSSFIAGPGASVYASSKFAVRAVTDSLRRELKPFGMSVILVAPGVVESEIWDKGKAYIEKLRQNVNPEIAQLYAPLAKFADKLNAELKKIPAIEVARSVEHAIVSNKPRLVYLVGKDARWAKKLSEIRPRILDWMVLKRIEKLGK